MSWHLRPMAAFDTETTGIDRENDRIVEATVAVVDASTKRADWTTRLIAVDIEIPETAQRIHGISTERARAEGAPADETLELIATELTLAMLSGLPVVGMNIEYDFTLLDRELRRNRLMTLPERLGRPIRPVVDVYVIDKALDQWRKGSRKLDALCTEYRVPQKTAHTSADDALNSARIAYQMMRRAQLDTSDLTLHFYPKHLPHQVEPIANAYRGLAGMTLDQLHDAQIVWRRQQQESLAAHFRGKGKRVDDINTSWPMAPHHSEKELV